jgi:anti-sigma factor RsiW
MTGPGEPILHDLELHAYVDGELSVEDARKVEARLAKDAAARALVAALIVQREALAQQFTLPDACPVPHEMAADVRAGRPPRP